MSTSAAQDAVRPVVIPAALTVPALTPVELVVDIDLGSKISVTGQTFPLHLASAIVIDGKELVPAGTIGQGEIVHAKKAGGSGAAGELVLAARYLEVDGTRVRLRSMRVALSGKDSINAVDAFNAASAASPLPVGVIGYLITGRNVVYPKGTRASAKTAGTFEPAPVAEKDKQALAEPAPDRAQ